MPFAPSSIHFRPLKVVLLHYVLSLCFILPLAVPMEKPRRQSETCRETAPAALRRKLFLAKMD